MAPPGYLDTDTIIAIRIAIIGDIMQQFTLGPCVLKRKNNKDRKVCFMETWDVKKYKQFKLTVRVKLYMKVFLIVKVLVAHIFQAWPTFSNPVGDFDF